MHSTQCSRWKLKHNKKYYETVLPELCGERRCECLIPVGTRERNDRMSHIRMRNRNPMNRFNVMIQGSFSKESMCRKLISLKSNPHWFFVVILFGNNFAKSNIVSTVHTRMFRNEQSSYTFWMWQFALTFAIVKRRFIYGLVVPFIFNKTRVNTLNNSRCFVKSLFSV